MFGICPEETKEVEVSTRKVFYRGSLNQSVPLLPEIKISGLLILKHRTYFFSLRQSGRSGSHRRAERTSDKKSERSSDRRRTRSRSQEETRDRKRDKRDRSDNSRWASENGLFTFRNIFILLVFPNL